MDDIELRSIRPGHYVVVENGEVLRPATAQEIRWVKFKQRIPDVDAGVVEVSVAVAAVAAVLATSAIPFAGRLLAAIAFFLSLIAAYLLYNAYMLLRLPLAINRYYRLPFGKSDRLLYVWVIWVWPFYALILWLSKLDPLQVDYFSEIGYVLLFWALLLVGSISMFFVLVSFPT